MALGAQRDQLLQLMLFDGQRLRPQLGLLLSFAATRIRNQASRSRGFSPA